MYIVLMVTGSCKTDMSMYSVIMKRIHFIFEFNSRFSWQNEARGFIVERFLHGVGFEEGLLSPFRGLWVAPEKVWKTGSNLLISVHVNSYQLLSATWWLSTVGVCPQKISHDLFKCYGWPWRQVGVQPQIEATRILGGRGWTPLCPRGLTIIYLWILYAF